MTKANPVTRVVECHGLALYDMDNQTTTIDLIGGLMGSRLARSLHGSWSVEVRGRNREAALGWKGAFGARVEDSGDLDLSAISGPETQTR